VCNFIYVAGFFACVFSRMRIRRGLAVLVGFFSFPRVFGMRKAGEVVGVYVSNQWSRTGQITSAKHFDPNPNHPGTKDVGVLM
jgi:hypothetical protein